MKLVRAAPRPCHLHKPCCHLLTASRSLGTALLLIRALLYADILRTMPSKAIELSAFDLYKRLLGGHDAAGKPKGPGGAATALAGALAGTGRLTLTRHCDGRMVSSSVVRCNPAPCAPCDSTSLSSMLLP